jgi:hypothetical protein
MSLDQFTPLSETWAKLQRQLGNTDTVLWTTPMVVVPENRCDVSASSDLIYSLYIFAPIIFNRVLCYSRLNTKSWI